MALIYVYVVDTHRVEIYAAVFLFLDALFERLQVGRQVFLPFLQPFLHTAVAPPHAAVL